MASTAGCESASCCRKPAALLTTVALQRRGVGAARDRTAVLYTPFGGPWHCLLRQLAAAASSVGTVAVGKLSRLMPRCCLAVLRGQQARHAQPQPQALKIAEARPEPAAALAAG